VRVVEGGNGPGLAVEPFEPAGLARDLRRQHFQRDVPAKPSVARTVDLAHSTGTQRGDDLVRTQSGPGSQRHDRA